MWSSKVRRPDEENIEKQTTTEEVPINLQVDQTYLFHQQQYGRFLRKHREELEHIFDTYIAPALQYTNEQISLKDWFLFAYTQST